MAEVFVARAPGPPGLKPRVAIKRIRAELMDDPEYRNMFRDEARVAAAIRSPYVVSTIELGRDEEGTPFIAMDYVEGASLKQLLRAHGAPMPPSIAAAILIQMARGLHDAHEAQSATGAPLRIVHRDVSPHNILVGIDGRARLTDFGIAWALNRAAQTQAGQVKGKLNYFSPEQAQGQTVDRRTDVWSLGIVAWEMLSGRRLFPGRDLYDLLEAILARPIARLDEIRGLQVPSPIASVVAKALVRNREWRFQSAADLAQELARCAPRIGSEEQVAAFVNQTLDHAKPPTRATQSEVRARGREDRTLTSPSRVSSDAFPRRPASASSSGLRPAEARLRPDDPPVRGRPASRRTEVLAPRPLPRRKPPPVPADARPRPTLPALATVPEPAPTLATPLAPRPSAWARFWQALWSLLR